MDGFSRRFHRSYRKDCEYVEKNGNNVKDFSILCNSLESALDIKCTLVNDNGIHTARMIGKRLECAVIYNESKNTLIFQINKFDQDEWKQFINFFCIGLQLFEVYEFWTQTDYGSQFLWDCPIEKTFIL